MTDTPEDRQPDSNGPHDQQPPPSGGVAGLLRQLLETLQRLDDTGGIKRGQDRRGETGFEYEYRVSLGLGSDDARPDDSRSIETDQPVSVEETLDGARVTIDLPAVDPETLQASVRGRRLVVAAADEPIARVQLPESGFGVRTATYNNGVLEILLGDGDTEVTLDD